MRAELHLTDHDTERHDPAGDQASAAMAEGISAALRRAQAQGIPFMVEWRRSPDTERARRQADGDASCGCGPVD